MSQEEITRRFRLTVPQTRAHRVLSPGNRLALWWGRGGGKTHFIELVWNLFVSKYDGILRSGVSPDGVPFERRGVRIIHLMPTFKQAKDVYAKRVEADLTGAGPWSFLGAKINKSTWSITFPGGSWIQWFGAREANSARGMRADVVTIDEADDIEPADHDAVVIPWTSEPWSLNLRVIAGTPRRGRHGLLYREGVRGQRREHRYHCFHATYRDSPGIISAEQVEEARRNTLPAVFSREWECNFDSAEGLVYSMFDESFHVRTAPSGPWDEILVGVDHGWEDPGVFLVTGVRGNGRDSECHVLEEVYEQHKEESWWIQKARDLKTKYQRFPMRWYGDPSRPDRIRALANGAGVRFHETNNAILDGVSAVTDRLVIRVSQEGAAQFSDTNVVKRARLFVDPRCRFTIWEMNNYRRRRDPADENRFLEQIVDKNNHCLVGGTMVQTEHGEKPIESVEIGERVWTRKGLRRVMFSGCTGENAPVLSVGLSNGRRLEGTAEHRVWTLERGWVTLDALRYGDTLLPWENTDDLSKSSSTEEVISATQSRHAQSCGTTSTTRTDGADCIRTSGSITTEQSLSGITFITETATRSTTTSPTSNACPRLSTSLTTAHCQGTSPFSVRGWMSPDNTPPPGTEAPRGVNGIGATDEMRGRSANPSSAPATIVEQSSNRSPCVTTTDFAPTPASPHGGAHQASTTRLGLVSPVGPPSKQTSTPGRGIAPVRALGSATTIGTARVYDLTIDEHPEFYASGVLVHNSMDALRYAILSRFGKPTATRIDSGAGY